ncbi:MAG: hypothetical protein FWF82_06690 [Oscillospiraceae bacterium]|nr:hypothetical protein [Oscillospiraceae bacterium]
MKIKKTLIAILVTAVLFATLAGCARNESDGIVAPISIDLDKNSEYSDISDRANPLDAIIFKIDTSHRMSKAEHNSYGNYKTHKIPELTEFYFPNLEIDEYEFVQITIDRGGFGYHYAPIKRGEEYFHFKGGIDVVLGRPDYKDEPMTFQESAKMNGFELTEDGFIYDESSNYCGVYGEIDGTHFRVTASDSFADYEYLRDIALRLVKSAELVDVKHELDVLRKSPDYQERVAAAEWGNDVKPIKGTD